MADLKPLKTEQDYKAALAELNLLIDAESGSPKGDRRDVLAILVDHFVRNRDVGEGPDPIDTIKAYMEIKNRSTRDLCRVIEASPEDAAAILTRKNALHVSDIRRLHASWNLPLEVLVLPYEIDPAGDGKTEIVMKPRWPNQRSTASLGTSKKTPR
jgi:HTH-type transcriptional regulator/antitoxin HigA